MSKCNCHIVYHKSKYNTTKMSLFNKKMIKKRKLYYGYILNEHLDRDATKYIMIYLKDLYLSFINELKFNIFMPFEVSLNAHLIGAFNPLIKDITHKLDFQNNIDNTADIIKNKVYEDIISKYEGKGYVFSEVNYIFVNSR